MTGAILKAVWGNEDKFNTSLTLLHKDRNKSSSQEKGLAVLDQVFFNSYQ